VEAGPDQGRRFTIPPAGARVGRSSGNDIVLTDPALSRFHCRLFFKDGALWINDLGSTNASLVNGSPVADRPLHTGDVVEFGETKMLILHDQPEAAPASAPPPASTPAAPAKLDLGLGRDSEAPPRDEPRSSKPSLVLVVVALAVVVVAAVYWLKPRPARPGPSGQPAGQPLAGAVQQALFEFSYEKEIGTTNNLFRYVLTLRDNTLAAQIDDAVSRRHVLREKKLAPEVLKNLRVDLDKLGFFDLRSDYAGVPRDGEWETRELAMTLGIRSHRVRVINRLDPDEFKPLRETLETFAQNELSLASLTLPPERLTELARESFQLGHKYLDEREVRADNLYNAIRTFEACQWYLETVEPKPAFFSEANDAAEAARKDLDKEYNVRLFEAEKAWSLSDWPKAAEQYRQILELIPDRSDDRHQNALKKQLDVERRFRR
jgi:hypothetical protein